MRFDITVIALVAFIAPSVLARNWEVNFVDGKFSPQELDIAPGDTVVWPNTDGDHAIVETNPGARTCNSKAGGFNSGRKAKGQPYQRTFPTQAVVNYKDGIGANCANGAVGTIFVGPRPAGPDPNATTTNGGTASPTQTSDATTTTTATNGGTASPTRTTSPTNSPTNSPTMTASPVVTPTPTHRPNSARGLSASENALFFGAVCFIGALAGL
jgi:plastocyanin